jgi:hypothetical protein
MNPFFKWWLNSTKIAVPKSFFVIQALQFCFDQLPFPISPNQLNLYFVFGWNMYSRYIINCDDIVKKMLVLLGFCLSVSIYNSYNLLKSALRFFCVSLANIFIT